jgi:hypothetical protein
LGGPYSVSRRCRSSSTALYRSSPAASCWNRPRAYSSSGLCGARVPLLLHCLSFAVRSSQSMTGDRSGASSNDTIYLAEPDYAVDLIKGGNVVIH